MDNKNMTAVTEAELENVSGGMIYDPTREYPPTYIDTPFGRQIIVIA